MPEDAMIHCLPVTGRVRVLFHGHLLADSGSAVLLRQDGRPDRYYFPKDDVEMVVLRRNDASGYAPGKGEAAFYTIHRDGHVIENIAWSYERPEPGAEDIAGMIAFDPDLVKIEPGSDARLEPEDPFIREYIRHTDSGSGLSQEERWDANVHNPDDLENRT